MGSVVATNSYMDDNTTVDNTYHQNHLKKDIDNDGHYAPSSSSSSHCQSTRHRDGQYSNNDKDDYYHNDDERGGHYSRKKSRCDSIANNNDDDYIPKTKKQEWPPNFDSPNGCSSFIFDARSGMFYEPLSDYFYDPKTKLYYSNEKKMYFQYDVTKSKEPHLAFQPFGLLGVNGGVGSSSNGSALAEGKVNNVQHVIVGHDNSQKNAMTAQGPSTTATVEEFSGDTKYLGGAMEMKPKIGISLKTPIPGVAGTKDIGPNSSLTDNSTSVVDKTKTCQKKKYKQTTTLSLTKNGVTLVLPQGHKKHVEDLNKWSERVKELREDDSTTDSTKQPQPQPTTVSGQPICLICRRKFANMEKLHKHEKLSDLHKENLAKKVAADEAAVAVTAATLEISYRDRTKERQLMHGSHVPSKSTYHAEALLAAHSAASLMPTDIIRPEDTLHDTNYVGNKLLQKMGWNSGDLLGRATVNTNISGVKDDVAGNLKSDWERIESIAKRGGRGR